MERARRRRLVVAVADHHGLRFREDPATRRASVADRKGRTVLVGGLGELWPAIERLSGRAPDPLCPDLLAALSAAGGADS